MLNFKRYIRDWFCWLVLVSILIIVSILYWYFSSNDSFESKTADWGDFGSLLGAITGLIAFIGALFTLRQNQQQFLNSEERSIFFELLKIFISYRDSLRVTRIDWKYNKTIHDWDITPHNEFCTPERTYQQIYFELYHIFYMEIRKSIPRNFSKDEFMEKIIPDKILPGQRTYIYYPLAIAINYIYEDYNWGKSGGMVNVPPLDLDIYDFLCLNAVKFYLEGNNIKPITTACTKAADQCFEIYKNKLGTYFNNAYNILDMISDFIVPAKYFNIFRAQLSKNELAILFFYSFSSLATPKTRKLYLKADLFKDLDLRDIRLKGGVNNKAVSREEYMKFSSMLDRIEDKDEYVSYDFLKKMYDCMDVQ